MTKAERYYNIIKWFEENVPIAESELHYDSPFHLLIAVILSAQCTDKRVNMVTPDIFVKYPDAKALASTTFEELFPLVRSISYPNSKAPDSDGADAFGGFRGRGPVGHRRSDETSRSRKKDRKRHSLNSLRQTCHSCRYTCFPRGTPTRVIGRKDAGKCG